MKNTEHFLTIKCLKDNLTYKLDCPVYEAEKKSTCETLLIMICLNSIHKNHIINETISYLKSNQIKSIKISRDSNEEWSVIYFEGVIVHVVTEDSNLRHKLLENMSEDNLFTQWKI